MHPTSFPNLFPLPPSLTFFPNLLPYLLPLPPSPPPFPFPNLLEADHERSNTCLSVYVPLLRAECNLSMWVCLSVRSCRPGWSWHVHSAAEDCTHPGHLCHLQIGRRPATALLQLTEVQSCQVVCLLWTQTSLPTQASVAVYEAQFQQPPKSKNCQLIVHSPAMLLLRWMP